MPVLTGEAQPELENPYTADYPTELLAPLGFDPYQRGLQAKVEVWTQPGAASLEQARSYFETYGVAILAPDCVLDDQGGNVADLYKQYGQDIMREFVALSADKSVVEPRDLQMTDNTERKMMVVRPENAYKIAAAAGLQRYLAGPAEAIGGKGTKVTGSSAEDMVINGLGYKPGAPDTAIQTQGAHFDFPDVTWLYYLANVGPGGRLAVVDGYDEACEELRLDPQGNKVDNIGKIVGDEKHRHRLAFRFHSVGSGSLAVVDSARHLHYVEAKTNRAVRQALDDGAEAETLSDGTRLTRLAVNIAFESPKRQEIAGSLRHAAAWCIAHAASDVLLATIQPGLAELKIPRDRWEAIAKALGGVSSSWEIYDPAASVTARGPDSIAAALCTID